MQGELTVKLAAGARRATSTSTACDGGHGRERGGRPRSAPGAGVVQVPASSSPPAGSAPTTTSPSWRPASPSWPARASSSRWPSAATPAPTCCAAASRSTGSARRAPTAAPSTSSSRRTGPGTEWLSALRAARRGRRRRAAGPAVPAARRAGRRACWSAAATAAPRCSGWPRRCASAAATSRWCSARRPRTGCSASSRRAAHADGVTVTTDDGSAGTKGWVTDVLPRGHPAQPAGVVYGCGPMGDAQVDHRRRRPPRRRRPGRGRGVDGLRRRRVHDLRHAGRRQRRGDPDGALLRRGTGVPRRPRAVGRVRRRARAGCPPTPSARPGRDGH